MNFGQALEHLKDGYRVYRTGWTGKWLGGTENSPRMYVTLQLGYPEGIPINLNTAVATGLPEGTVCVFRPYLVMKLPDDSFVPYTATNTDILADDWGVG